MEEVKMEWDEWFAKYQPVMVDAVTYGLLRR